MMLSYSSRVRGSEILDKRSSSDAQISSCHGSMKILGAEEMAIHPLHQSVEHFAGPMCVWMIIVDAIISYHAYPVDSGS